jgi:hypothetical protein
MSLSERSAVPFARLPDSWIRLSEKSGCSDRVALQFLAQPPRLGAVFVGLVFGQVDLIFREPQKVAMVDMGTGHLRGSLWGSSSDQ